MTKTKQRYGCLTIDMIEFLEMDEKVRLKRFTSNNISKKYERIRKNVEASFLDAQIAYGYLPKNQREKIDIVQSYNELLDYVTKNKLADKIADVPVNAVHNQLDAILGTIKNKELRKYTKRKFNEFKEFLNVLEINPPYRILSDKKLSMIPSA